MTNEANKVNETLNEIVENFLSELSNMDGCLIYLGSIAECVLERAYTDNYIGSMYTSENEEWLTRNAKIVRDCSVWIMEEFGEDALIRMYKSLSEYGPTRMVLDIHSGVLEWFIKTYDIINDIQEELDRDNDYIGMTLDEDSIEKISEVFRAKVLEHGDKELF